MLRALYGDPHVTVSVDDDARIVRYTRSREPYPSLDALRSLNERVSRALAAPPPGKLRLLVDVREAPARNDTPFESEIIRMLQSSTPRFSATAVLVRSAVGRLQVRRIGKTQADVPETFADESLAVAYLRGGDAEERK